MTQVLARPEFAGWTRAEWCLEMIQTALGYYTRPPRRQRGRRGNARKPPEPAPAEPAPAEAWRPREPAPDGRRSRRRRPRRPWRPSLRGCRGLAPGPSRPEPRTLMASRGRERPYLMGRSRWPTSRSRRSRPTARTPPMPGTDQSGTCARLQRHPLGLRLATEPPRCDNCRGRVRRRCHSSWFSGDSKAGLISADGHLRSRQPARETHQHHIPTMAALTIRGAVVTMVVSGGAGGRWRWRLRCPVEDLVRWAFAHAPVVMANRGAQRPGALRPDPGGGVRMIQAAHGAGILRDQAPPPLDGWAERRRAGRLDRQRDDRA